MTRRIYLSPCVPAPLAAWRLSPRDRPTLAASPGAALDAAIEVIGRDAEAVITWRGPLNGEEDLIEQRRRQLLVRLATMTDTDCDMLDGYRLRSDAQLAQGGEGPAFWRPAYSTHERDRAIALLHNGPLGGGRTTAELARAVDLVAEALGMERGA